MSTTSASLNKESLAYLLDWLKYASRVYNFEFKTQLLNFIRVLEGRREDSPVACLQRLESCIYRNDRGLLPYLEEVKLLRVIETARKAF